MRDREVATFQTPLALRQAADVPFPVESGHSAPVRQDSLLEIVWRRRQVVLVTTVAALLMGLIYCVIASPRYTATSRLFVEPAGADAKAGRDSSDRAAFLFTQREVVSSTPVLAMALGQPGILELKTFEGQSSPFEYLHNTLSVDVGKKDELITVSFDSPHREEATQVVAAVVEAYSHFQSSQRTASTTGTTATLKAAKEKTEAEIAAKSKALQDFAIEHNVVGSDDQRRQLDAQSVNTIAASITSAHMDTLAAKARVDEAKRLGGHDAEPEADAPAIADAHVSVEDDQLVLKQFRDATLALQNLKRQLSPSHPVRMQMQQRVDQLAALHRSILTAAFDAAVQREKDLREFYAAEQRRTIEQNTYAAEYARRAAELARLQTLSDSMDTRVRELNVGDIGGMASVMVLEQAHADTKASSPQKLRALALATVLGLVLGCVGACLGDRL
ncbi:MAG: exopolysaccharide biosynthesis protein, partial [Phycisphaerales bacterium]|nr:exopolysaccharide biosynthesis protein [Phycisphaerales bacterium]